jgi:glycosyltransferase involved in cell wall biosynthesis
MGPGQFDGYQAPPPVNSHRIVLIGRAPHKRNEYAARLLSESTLVNENYEVTAVGLSETAKHILRSRIDITRLSFRDEITSEQVASLLSASSVLVAMGVSEGFGFPYAEATYFGSDVIAPEQPIIRELFGSDGNYLAGPECSLEEFERALKRWDAARVGRLQAQSQSRSWTFAAEATAHAVRAAVQN